MMNKKNLYLVFGTANKGKSSLIRCLTGIFRGRTTKIKRINDEVLIKVFVSSAQEKWISIEELIEKIDSIDVEHYLISIRIDEIRNKYGTVFPEGQKYYDELIKRYNILGVTIFGNEKMNIDDNLITRIENPRKDSPNYDASIVRKKWGWI
ncbi:hypothetical protein [uncultured Winogradskyella sp.]|uniref:hypothetical protein n=1 Tax=uncultured Winogradskyella sp. TaxID=395353 RepID=UPI0026279364|nr:hypothetical protein [uncultured Winogradskyella sp.]